MQDAPAVNHADIANSLRFLMVDAVERAGSGHPGMPMGMIDVATVLFARFLVFDPKLSNLPYRDRFVLSAGHGSMLLNALLHLYGYLGWDVEALKSFRQLGSPAAGHPECDHGAGIEITTGPPAQGLATAVGMALAEEMDGARFGRDLVAHRACDIAGDGCLMEGVGHVAISLIGYLRLKRLVVLFDDNGVVIDGETSLAASDDHRERLEAKGIGAAVVSLPSFVLFDERSAEYRAIVFGSEGSVRIGVEAALRFGRERHPGEGGGFVDMTGFDASAPVDELYRHFGIAAEAEAFCLGRGMGAS